MQRLQAFKFELQPTGEQVRSMRRFAGNARKVWNLALDKQQQNHAAGEKFTHAFGMNNWLPAWKTEYPYLAESPSQTLQQVMGDLARAYTNFFARRAAFPRFKKKGLSDSFRFPQGFKLDQPNSRIFLPKLGWIRYRNSRDILGAAKNITVSTSSGRWFVSIQTEREVAQPVYPAAGIVGIDVGITRFATLSDGSHIEPLNTFRCPRTIKFRPQITQKGGRAFRSNSHLQTLRDAPSLFQDEILLALYDPLPFCQEHSAILAAPGVHYEYGSS